MFLGSLTAGVVYLAAALALFIIGKYIFDLFYRGLTLKEELVEKDNTALAIALAGYLFGLSLAVGGALSAPSISFTVDMIDIFLYGIIAMALLSLSVRINGWLIFRHFSTEKEIIKDQNWGVGMIEASNYIAMGLIVYGAVSGGGGVKAVAGFSVLGQITLIAAAWLYNRLAPFDVHDAIERDNYAVGVAFSGMILAIGNIVRFAEQQAFDTWLQNLGFYFTVVVFGLIALPVTRLITDKIILPGKRLTDELVNQEKPNIGAGVIEAAVYITMSFLIGWCFK